MKTLKLIALTTAIAATMSTAQAADLFKVPGVTTSGSVAFATDYRFRGISQTSNNPAVQAGLNFNHESGVYVGVWGSNVDSVVNKGSTEIDGIVGYATKLPLITGLDTTVDVGYIRYAYAGSGKVPAAYYDGSGDKADPANYRVRLKDEQPDYNEIYAKLGLANGIIKGDNLIAGVNYSNDYYNKSGDFVYLSASYTAPVLDTGFGVVGGVGYNLFKSASELNKALGTTSSDDNYVDYKAGVTFGMQGINAELAYVGSNIKDKDCFDKKSCDGSVQFTLSKAF